MNDLPAATPSFGKTFMKNAARALAPPSLLVTRGPAHRRGVALTFDDGPDALLDEYLAILERHRARATFFVLGSACAKRRGALLDIVRAGHEVASHGYSHRRFPTLSGPELDDELVLTAALLPVPLTRRPLLRPPQGATSLRSLARSALRGYTTVLWSLDSDDCRTRSPEEVIAKVAPRKVAPGEIVLFHEAQEWTLAALGPILEGLTRAGYALVTVGELLGL